MDYSMDPYQRLVQDLKDESDELIELIKAERLEALTTRTPAKGWDVADSIKHLTYFDGALSLAIEDREGFEVAKKRLLAGGVEIATEEMRLLAIDKVVESFIDARSSMIALLSTTPSNQRVPWYGPEMSAMSATSARLMETFAHGLDVYDALGKEKPFTDRISHICFLGSATIAFSFVIHNLTPPTEPIYLELVLPSGSIYSKGDQSAKNSIRGSAKDYALLVTQRRARRSLDLVANGEIANSYLDIAQAFAGNPSRVDPDRYDLT
ncbi:MAG: TIGR03084 family metal-binding protein [Actinomycetota bacterium]|nr:TIGR03084 family metal-binding protein [Actinomycetota bacterium]